MTIDKVLVIIFGMLGVVFTYWFFLMKKDKVVYAKDSIDIVVEGGYSPSVVSIPKGKKTKLNFIRKDTSSCLEEIVLPDFKIKKDLPMNEKITIELEPKMSGEFGYSCGMNMFHGKIVVV